MIVTGQVDRDGLLIAADPRLLALQNAAGGTLGSRVAVPQIATLSRLARTLGILVSRPVIAAEGLSNVELLVRARAEGDVVHLSIGGWNAVPLAKPTPLLVADRAHDFARLEADAAWETDAEFMITRFSPGLATQNSSISFNVTGKRLTSAFRLLPDEEGHFSILDALALRTGFVGQLAELDTGGDVRVRLSGLPVIDDMGQFAGLHGSFMGIGAKLDDDPVEDVDTPLGTGLTERLDGAIRGPLGKIIATADSISTQSDGPLRRDYADYASDISSAGRHLLGLVDDLVDVQAIERDDFAIETEKVDVADIARRAAGLLSVRAADRSVRIDRPDNDEILFAHGDFGRLLQILVNLIGNAVRYSPNGGMVWIRTEQEGDLTAIVVADIGKGIAVQDQERIFERFERVDATEAGGSGLGLYIARKLARAMGGDITVDSAPGQGARFVLTLRTFQEG